VTPRVGSVLLQFASDSSMTLFFFGRALEYHVLVHIEHPRR